MSSARYQSMARQIYHPCGHRRVQRPEHATFQSASSSQNNKIAFHLNISMADPAVPQISGSAARAVERIAMAISTAPAAYARESVAFQYHG